MESKEFRASRVVLIAGIAGIMFSCAHGVVGREPASERPATSAQPWSRVDASRRETPAPAESNLPGDIPDSQAFVRYTSPSGRYEVEAPEGWSRTTTGSSVEFRDKYNGESVRLIIAPHASGDANTIPSIRRAGHAVRIGQVTTTQVGRQSATLISFTSNSDANPVTGRKIRLDNEAIVYSAGNRAAILTLWAPARSDNVDQWNRIARSFRWR